MQSIPSALQPRRDQNTSRYTIAFEGPVNRPGFYRGSSYCRFAESRRWKPIRLEKGWLCELGFVT